jgi:predicted dehydrogenase
MDTVRWGILSTANIGMSKVIPAIQRASNCEVVAIASRSADTAAEAAAALGIPASYGTYDELLASDDIDAVYIPLPNNLHAEWVSKAAAAGKDILCEKPLAMSSVEAESMVDECRAAGVRLQEAFMYRHHPSWVEVVRIVRSGQIGQLQAVQSWFSYFNDDPTNIRNRTENGGGAMMDIGCYNIHVPRLLFGEEPSNVVSAVRRDAVMGVDVLSSAVLSFPGGGQSSFTCSIRSEPYQRVHVFGTTGRIEVEIPFNIPPDAETRIFVTRDELSETESATISFPPLDQYTAQAEGFAAAILAGDDVPVPATDAVANMKVLEAVLAPS